MNSGCFNGTDDEDDMMTIIITMIMMMMMMGLVDEEDGCLAPPEYLGTGGGRLNWII